MSKTFLLLLLPLSFACQHSKNVSPADKANISAHSLRLSYDETKKRIDSVRRLFKTAFIAANDTHKHTIRSSIKGYLTNIIGTEMCAYWKGTSWDFNGTTRIPGQGSIACGFFVTTVLEDAGVKLRRRELAICPSLTMMKTLTSAASIENLSALDYPEFTSRIRSYGKEVFIVGLDFHTGFIINDGNGSYFIHSNYINKQGVTKETIDESRALRSSKTRYLTCLTKNEKFLQNWLFH